MRLTYQIPLSAHVDTPFMKTQKPDTRFLHLNNSEQCLPMEKSPSQCHSIVGCCLAMWLLEVLIDLSGFLFEGFWVIYITQIYDRSESRPKNIQIQFLNDNFFFLNT